MEVALINFTIFLVSIGLGFIYTYFCRFHDKWQHQKIYHGRLASFNLRKNLKLILTNLFILCLLSFGGMWYFQEYFLWVTPSVMLFITQLLIIALLDDLEFYCWHRFLHSHPYMMRHIHSIHHRARVPYPIEFIYAHPIEWLGGMLGLVLAVVLIIFCYGGVNAYVLWIFTAYRTLRELDIHSNLEPKYTKFLPFLCNAKHHSLHHNRVRGNFASTFTYLDRLFGTQLH